MLFLLYEKLIEWGLPYVFAKLFSQIDQKINELVAEQQKNDAKLAHDKSELEQFRQDIANAERQKLSISKALEKKVSRTITFTLCLFHL